MQTLIALLLFLAALSSRATAQASPFDYDARQALDWRDSLVATEEGVEEYRFSFRSPKGAAQPGASIVPSTRPPASDSPG